MWYESSVLSVNVLKICIRNNNDVMMDKIIQGSWKCLEEILPRGAARKPKNGKLVWIISKDLMGKGPYLYGDLCVFTHIQISPHTDNHSRSLCHSQHRAGIEKHQNASSGGWEGCTVMGNSVLPLPSLYLHQEPKCTLNEALPRGAWSRAATGLLGLVRFTARSRLRDGVPGQGLAGRGSTSPWSCAMGCAQWAHVSGGAVWKAAWAVASWTNKSIFYGGVRSSRWHSKLCFHWFGGRSVLQEWEGNTLLHLWAQIRQCWISCSKFLGKLGDLSSGKTLMGSGSACIRKIDAYESALLCSLLASLVLVFLHKWRSSLQLRQ